jgi:PST family polysaccharide transporter
MVMPASAFGRVVNRVLFPVMAQVQDERKRLAAGYERALAIVALVSLPISSSLWVVAPEFIRVVLGPAWDPVVLPFRLFTISLLFRMSSRISDACTKAAGAVYLRAAIQWLYAVLVIAGAIAGQRWGVGGVAVGVSIAMAINWLNMAWLGRSVTGLSWGRFARAHAPGALLAALIGVAVATVAQTGRAAHLGSLLILLATGITGVAIVIFVSTLRPASFLGQHGVAAWRQGLELLARRRAHGLTSKAGDRSSLASAGEVDSK